MRIMLAVVFAIATLSTVFSFECGLTKKQTDAMNNINSRIIGGVETELGQWPWIAGLTKINQTINGRPFCSGSLIHPKWILTAAHCFRFPEFREVRVTLGDRNYTKEEGTEQRRKVIRIVEHPKFSLETADNDYALVELESPVEINDFVRPICLPRRPRGRYAGRNCKIIGWGISFVGDFSVTRPEVLLEGDVRIFNASKCSNLWKSRVNITRNMVCASGPNQIPAHCFGDSGGPIQCQNERTGKWFVVGSSSFSTDFCDVIPPVSSYVPTKLRWIRKFIGW